MTWQPIESAEKVSRHKLFFGDGQGFLQCVYVGGWHHGREIWIASFDGRPAFPTHWMPLPDPPVQP